MQRIRVLVVDDHRIFAESLATALTAEPGLEVSAVGSAAAALRRLEREGEEGRTSDVLLVDVALEPAEPPEPAKLNGHAGPPRELLVAGFGPQDAAPGGLALIARVGAEYPGMRCVVLAERDDARCAAAALQTGAFGWVGKNSSLARLLQVVHGVADGETHLPPLLLTAALRELTADRRHRTESELLVESLTPREHEVLRCMVAGLGRKAVAERLYLSPHTVRTHMQNVLGKLGVHSTLAAVALARRAGVGPVELEGGDAAPA
jgi:DNA-binding NarL/FixJ family response regulator